MNAQRHRLLLFMTIAFAIASQAHAQLPVTGGTWSAQGPAPIFSAQVDGIENSPVSGAIHAIAPHPSNADILWIGAVNGGVWKTTNATSASPTWTPMGDGFSSLSIGALQLDPTDATANTLVAGIGEFSSFGSGGAQSGLLRTTNGGTNWTLLSSMSGRNVSGIAPRGATIVAAVDLASPFTCTNVGIFRSLDSGTSFSIVSGAMGTGLPQGTAYDLASDPTNNAVLYTATRLSPVCAGIANGVFKSTDTGLTWTRVSDATMDALLVSAGNVKIAVGASGEVYVGIISGGELAGLFRSGTGGTSWTQLDTPATNEGGTVIGIHPRKKPGSQGSLHFSIVADPTNANIVYVGGDRQPLGGDGNASSPNSIGSTNFTGRLFRVNAAAASGSQATPLTHCQTALSGCNSTTSTTSNSAPHADSRRMRFDAGGNLLESDDGGIYRRTNPRTTGDWFSVIGNLAVTELHDIGWDRVSNMIVGGSQDNGTSEQTTVGGTVWELAEGGDGGDVAIDDFTSGTQSRRYTSAQFLLSFFRRTVDATGTPTSFEFPFLTVLGGGDDPEGQFVTPMEVNAVDGTRILFAAGNDLYESFDRGDTITALGLGEAAAAIVYGGKSGGVNHASVIYAISSEGLNSNGPNVYVRTSGTGAPVQTATSPGTAVLRDIAVDSTDWNKAYVVNVLGQVFSTDNAGGTWTNVTGNLGTGSTSLETIVFIPGSPNAIAVGGRNGVFRMATNAAGTWHQLGSGLANAPVWDLEYDAADDTLVAGTLGRGAWTLTPVVNVGPLPSLSINDVSITEGNSGTTNATFTVSLSTASTGTVTVDFATANGTATAGGLTFSSSSGITIPAVGSPDVGNATPYPSTISVSDMGGTITKVTATLSGYNHTFPRDVDVLLVGPGGQSVVLMSDAGNNIDASGLQFTFDDAAVPSLPTTPLSSGTFKPTNIADGEGPDSYSSPAPASGHGSTLSVFNGTAANGTWSLFVVDDFNGDGGTLSGWSLTITTTGGDFAANSGTLTFTAGVLSQPVSVTINGDTDTESSETFTVNLSNPFAATIADAQGQGTITNDDGGAPPAAPTNVVAVPGSPTLNNISWDHVPGATAYRVFRSQSGMSFSLLTEVPFCCLSDGTASANTAYLYKVRAFNGTESADSNIDLATTVIFTDPTLTQDVSKVNAVHFTELLTAVNAVRTLAGLGTIAFTDPAPGTVVTVRRQHVLDLRSGLDAARAILTLSAISYTDPTITSGVTKIKTAHITDLRDGVK